MMFVALTIAGFLIGGWVLRPLGLSTGLRGLLCRLLTGFCLCAVLALVIGSFSLHICLWVILSIVFLGTVWELSRRPQIPHLDTITACLPGSFLEWIALGAIIIALLCALVGALAPITSWDATVAHLALAKDYAREGHLFLNTGNEYSGYPHLYHTLLTVAYAGSGECAATLLNLFFAILALGAGAHCAYAVFRDRRCAWLTAGMLATTPVFFDQAQAPSIDLPHTALTLAMIAACFEWRNTRGEQGTVSNRWLWLAAFFAGSACGIRHTGYLIVFFLFLGAIVTPELRKPRTLATLGLIALLGAAPWFGRTLILLGNPIYPFLPGVFGESSIPHWNLTGLAIHATTTDSRLLLWLRYPWDLVMYPQRFDGWTKSPGAWVLVFGISGLFIGGARARSLGLFSGAGLTCLFFFQRLTRYALPFLAPMFVVASAGACGLPRLRRLVTVVVTILFGYGLALDVMSIHFKVRVALGLEQQKNYLTRRVERHDAFTWANKHIPKDQILFSFDRRTYYFDGCTFQNDTPLRYLVEKPISEQLAWLRAQQIRWVFVPVTFMEESGGYNTSLLPMVNAWRQDAQHFIQRAALDMARPRTSGTERVEIYEVRYE